MLTEQSPTKWYTTVAGLSKDTCLDYRTDRRHAWGELFKQKDSMVSLMVINH